MMTPADWQHYGEMLLEMDRVQLELERAELVGDMDEFSGTVEGNDVERCLTMVRRALGRQ